MTNQPCWTSAGLAMVELMRVTRRIQGVSKRSHITRGSPFVNHWATSDPGFGREFGDKATDLPIGGPIDPLDAEEVPPTEGRR
jgi:hypothetical protein